MPWPGLSERPVWFVAWVSRITAAARWVALPRWAGCNPGAGRSVELLSWSWLLIGLCLLTVHVVAGQVAVRQRAPAHLGGSACAQMRGHRGLDARFSWFPVSPAR